MPEKKKDDPYSQEYDELAQQAPAREVEMPAAKSNGEGGQTLGEAIGAAEDMTDLQYAMARLFPAVVDYNATMIGRIDPNILLSALHLMSVNEIMQADPEKAIDVNATYMRNYVRLSIGLDGRGRIDTAELLGAAREEKRTERLLGAGGI